MSVHETAGQILAQFPDQGGQGEDFGKSSPVGLLLMVLLAIAVVLLVRSMTKHLKKLSTNFDEKKAAAAAPARAKSAGSAKNSESADSTESSDGAGSTRGATDTDPASGDDADGARSSASGDSAPAS